ncbi:MAG: SagB/ThcOx family dehydrogenase [Sedimentisphaerales bacterium]|nr:SagB/ThcOx family dehydrogenase [Sedimentisphaerales bacterium]
MTSGAGNEFIEKTKYENMAPSPQQKGDPPPVLQADFTKDKDRIDLPKPENIGGEIQTVIEQRTSVRKYSEKKLTQQELVYLLWCTQGVKKIEAGLHTFRNVPSAGARHAIETFVLANRIEGLEPLLYQYLALEHKLAIASHDNRMADKISMAAFGQDMLKTSAASFIWVADIKRMAWRYGERGYRYIFLDAGHVCQNLYLAAEAIGCGVCAVAAFDDDLLNETLGIDGKNHFVIYLAAIGKKPL